MISEQSNMKAVIRWEAAWTEYVEALADREGKHADRFRRGHVRAYKCACRRVSRAIRTLEQLGAKFHFGEIVTVAA
jgi:hypothetical protein